MAKDKKNEAGFIFSEPGLHTYFGVVVKNCSRYFLTGSHKIGSQKSLWGCKVKIPIIALKRGTLSMSSCTFLNTSTNIRDSIQMSVHFSVYNLVKSTHWLLMCCYFQSLGLGPAPDDISPNNSCDEGETSRYYIFKALNQSDILLSQQIRNPCDIHEGIQFK